jgi:minor histocompatibility antigen H13
MHVQTAYVGGLGIAFGVNAVTHLGQPALLYLVPATLGAIMLVAVLRGEVGRLLRFVDHPSPLVEKASSRTGTPDKE